MNLLKQIGKKGESQLLVPNYIHADEIYSSLSTNPLIEEQDKNLSEMKFNKLHANITYLDQAILQSYGLAALKEWFTIELHYDWLMNRSETLQAFDDLQTYIKVNNINVNYIIWASHLTKFLKLLDFKIHNLSGPSAVKTYSSIFWPLVSMFSSLENKKHINWTDYITEDEKDGLRLRLIQIFEIQWYTISEDRKTVIWSDAYWNNCTIANRLYLDPRIGKAWDWWLVPMTFAYKDFDEFMAYEF